MNAESSGSLPLRRQQASDIRRRRFCTDDELAAVIESCKHEGGETARIVCCDSLTPEPIVFLANYVQLRAWKM